MKNPTLKTIAVIVLFAAYVAALLKLLVFKYPPGMSFSFANANFIPFKTISIYLAGRPNWFIAGDNLLGNILPFIPLGLIAPLFYRRLSWMHMLAGGVLLGLCIESLQALLRVGIFDVDDILLTIFGTMLGYALYASAALRQRRNAIVGGIVLVILIGAAAYVVHPRFHTHAAPAAAPANPGWKVYDNKEIGLYLEYPPTFTQSERVIAKDNYVEVAVDDPETGTRYLFIRSYGRQSDIDNVRDFFTGPYPKQVSISNISPLQTAVVRRLYGMQGVEVYGHGGDGGGYNDQFFYLHNGRLWVISLNPIIEGHATLKQMELGTTQPSTYYKEIYERLLASIRIAPTTPPTSKEALAQLQADLKTITPHVVASSTAGTQDITPEERRITIDIAALLSAQYAVQAPTVNLQQVLSELSLEAFSKRYLLVSQAEADKLTDYILDSKTGEMTPVPKSKRYILAPGRNMVLYIAPQAVYTYSLDQASTTLVLGSQLQGTETYDNGATGLGIVVNPQETHTTHSITISIFDSSKNEPNGEEGTVYAKIGQKTLAF